MCWCKAEDFPCLASTGISLAATVYTFEKQFHCVMSSAIWDSEWEELVSSFQCKLKDGTSEDSEHRDRKLLGPGFNERKGAF